MKRKNTKRSIASTKTSVVEALVKTCKEQGETINKLLSTIRSDGSRMVSYVKNKYRTRNESAAEHANKKSNSDYFLESLREIGRPATTWEIANKLKKINPHFKSLSRNKKSFMQVVYSAASYLTKEKTVDRKPVGKRNYEYFLHDWKVAA